MIVLTCAALGQDQAGQTTSKLIVERLEQSGKFLEMSQICQADLRIEKHPSSRRLWLLIVPVTVFIVRW